jgi:hypothetical protein
VYSLKNKNKEKSECTFAKPTHRQLSYFGLVLDLFGKKRLFDKQEVVSMGVGRRNDRTKWQRKEQVAVVSLGWTEFFR